jgi:hypothetical protein
MLEFLNSTLHPIASLGELIDTIAALFYGIGELFRAIWSILRLIGRLLGG